MTSRQTESRRSFSSWEVGCLPRFLTGASIDGVRRATRSAPAQLAVSNNPSKLRHPQPTLADVVLSAALEEMNDEPPAQRAETPKCKRHKNAS